MNKQEEIVQFCIEMSPKTSDSKMALEKILLGKNPKGMPSLNGTFVTMLLPKSQADDLYENYNLQYQVDTETRPINCYYGFQKNCTRGQTKRYQYIGVSSQTLIFLFEECKKIGFCRIYPEYNQKEELLDLGMIQFYTKDKIPEDAIIRDLQAKCTDKNIEIRPVLQIAQILNDDQKMAQAIFRERFPCMTLVINHPPLLTTKQTIQKFVGDLIQIKIPLDDISLEDRDHGISAYVKINPQKGFEILKRSETEVFSIGKKKVNIREFYNCDLNLLINANKIQSPKVILKYFEQYSKQSVAIRYTPKLDRKAQEQSYLFYACFRDQRDAEQIFNNKQWHFIGDVPIKLKRCYKFGEHSKQDFEVFMEFKGAIQNMNEFEQQLQDYAQKSFGELRDSVYIRNEKTKPKNGLITLSNYLKFKDEHQKRGLATISEKICGIEVSFQPAKSSRDICLNQLKPNLDIHLIKKRFEEFGEVLFIFARNDYMTITFCQRQKAEQVIIKQKQVGKKMKDIFKDESQIYRNQSNPKPNK